MSKKVKKMKMDDVAKGEVTELIPEVMDIATPVVCEHAEVESYVKNPRVYYPREMGTRCRSCKAELS